MEKKYLWVFSAIPAVSAVKNPSVNYELHALPNTTSAPSNPNGTN